MLTLRLACPTDLSEAASAILAADPTVSSLTIWRAASAKPVGDVIWADIPARVPMTSWPNSPH